MLRKRNKKSGVETGTLAEKTKKMSRGIYSFGARPSFMDELGSERRWAVGSQRRGWDKRTAKAPL